MGRRWLDSERIRTVPPLQGPDACALLIAGWSAIHRMLDLFAVGQGRAHEREEGVGVSGAVDDLEVPGGELVE